MRKAHSRRTSNSKGTRSIAAHRNNHLRPTGKVACETGGVVWAGPLDCICGPSPALFRRDRFTVFEFSRALLGRGIAGLACIQAPVAVFPGIPFQPHPVAFAWRA